MVNSLFCKNSSFWVIFEVSGFSVWDESLNARLYKTLITCSWPKGDMAVFHSIQGRIQPMWPSPPLLWVLFLSMFFSTPFLHLGAFIFFSHLCSLSVTCVLYCHVLTSVPCLFYHNLNPMTPLSLGPVMLTDWSLPHFCLQCELSLGNSYLHISLLSFCLIIHAKKYLKLRWQDALTARPSHALQSYSRNVPYTCSHGVHSHPTYILCSSKIIIV